MLMLILKWTALFAIGFAPAALRAQASGMAYVRVHVADTANAPLKNVDLAVVRNGRDVVLFGQTDAAGRYTFRFEPDTGRYRLTARALGYVTTARLLPVAARETLTVEFAMAKLPPALDTIKVSTTPLPLARQPFIGADEIAKDTRMVVNLRDVIGKLRPDIGYQSYKCVANGSGRSAQGLIQGRGGRSTRAPARRGPPIPPARVYVDGVWAFDGNPWENIQADHIAEIRYVNCLDNSIPGLPERAWPSIYVVLKPGYIWDIKWGSHEDPDAPPPPPVKPPPAL